MYYHLKRDWQYLHEGRRYARSSALMGFRVHEEVVFGNALLLTAIFYRGQKSI